MCHPKSPFTKLFLTLSLFILFLCTVPVDGQQRIVKGFLIEPGADLTWANLVRVSLTEADLTGVDLTEADLTGANLSQADLTGAELIKVNLIGANLGEATLIQATLAQALYDGNTIFPADFDPVAAGMFLLAPGVNLSRADLAGSYLALVDLTGATLIEASLIMANLMGADLTEAIYDAATQFPADFGDPQQRGMLITVLSTEDKPVAKLTGDINGDGIVNIFDLVIAAGSFGKTGAGIMGDVNGDDAVNIFDLVIVAGNFGQSIVVAAPAMTAKIELTTEQKHHIATAIDQLVAQPERSSAEEMVLGVLQAILPERLPTQTQLLANYPNPFNPETWIPFQLSQDAEVKLTIYDVTGKTSGKCSWAI